MTLLNQNLEKFFCIITDVYKGKKILFKIRTREDKMVMERTSKVMLLKRKPI